MNDFIIVRGAREHNLKNVDVRIPRNKLVTITGPSGSGKSSLAFDTIYAEGQRRYVESLSAYARQFLQIMKKPDVDSIEGLSPAISIEQKTVSNNPRSTVATITELYDYMRLLFARVGVPYSPFTNQPIVALTVDQIAQKIFEYPPKTKLFLLAPVLRQRKGSGKKVFQEIQEKGYTRVKVDNDFYELDELPELDANKAHTISVVVDRMVIPETPSDEFQTRLVASIESCLDLAHGLIWIEDYTTQKVKVFSSRYSCPESGFSIEEIEPRLFSFNSPQGACPKCEGLGYYEGLNIDLLIPDQSIPLNKCPFVFIQSFGDKNVIKFYDAGMELLAKTYKFSLTSTFQELPPHIQDIVLDGDLENDGTFMGILTLFKETTDEGFNVEGSYYDLYSRTQCKECNGYRLKPEALSVKIADIHIGQLAEKSIEDAYQWATNLGLKGQKKELASSILKEIQDRLYFLNSVGLNYLTLNRVSGTLSGGESQRIRLASQIGSRLTGVMYVLDEPSIGLHQRDNDRLISTLKDLRDLGNTVIVVEHDEDFMHASDQIIDVGPFSGVHGGKIVAQGTPQEIEANPNSVTGQYLSGAKEIPVPQLRRHGRDKLIINGAYHNNLKHVRAEFPLGCFIAVTGVSGSGKSSLVMSTLRYCKNFYSRLDLESIKGAGLIDFIIDIDQTPIGRTPRSNPATYVGCFTPIREWFAGLPESKARGYAPGRFSFNVRGGRCEACQGDGVVKTSMHFMADVYTTCDQCNGKRFNNETLSIKYQGLNIYDILELTVDQGAELFAFHKQILNRLTTLQAVGLGYIKIGQNATTLSGGEAQRVKLAKELSKRSTGNSLYILDEPTTGLHFDDIKKLLEILHMFVAKGNTVVVIEHNLDVIKTADWIIDLGPEGGHHGGEIVAVGTPEDIVRSEKSITGKYLKKYLKNVSNV